MHASEDGRFAQIQLAQDTFPFLSVVVVKLASVRVSRSLGQLSGYLCSFAEEAAHLPQRDKKVLEKSGAIGKALRELENVLQRHQAGAASLSRAEYPALDAIATAQRLADEGSSNGLKHLLLLEAKLLKSLSISATQAERIALMVHLCSKIRADDELEDDELLTGAADDLPGYARHAKAVHRVLSHYASCSCGNAPELELACHPARLRLKPVQKLSHGNLATFEMIFSASPSPAQSGTYDWQEVHILVPTKDKLSKRVQFWQSDPQPNAAVHPAVGPNPEPVGGSLCEFISNACGSTLCFKTDGDRLMALKDEIGDVPFARQVASHPGLSLNQILSQFNMAYRLRPVLAYTLAKAVWHYYDSEWMNVGWNKENVRFMNEGHGEEQSYYPRPYLCARLHVSDEIIPEYRATIGLMHRYPRILSLGIMLAEIAIGRSIELEGDSHNWTAKQANQILTNVRTIVSASGFRDDCNFPRYKKAVEKCLDPKLFKNVPFNIQKPRENLEKRRLILHDEVIEPLRQLIEGTGWNAEFDEIERTSFVPKRQPGWPEARWRPSSGTHDVGDLPMAPKPQIESRRDSWLARIAAINHKIVQETRKVKEFWPLKIGILDTGYDEDAPSFYIPEKHRRMKGWHDFVSNSLIPVDTDGHGTHLAALLLQVAPSAEIYVARVAENSTGLANAQNNISQAIRLATTKWDVDFITMSFGFPTHAAEIRDAISDAVYQKKDKISFFAAASNDGFNSREMFPANLDSVLAIRGTNRSGAFEPDFNPPSSTSGPVFGTLGRDVYSDWIDEDGQRSMSGCSVATPIAVGIACMLLDYAALRTAEFRELDLRLMRTKRGIFEIFKEIGIHAGEDRYYIAPFDFFTMDEDTRIAKLKAAIRRHPESW